MLRLYINHDHVLNLTQALDDTSAAPNTQSQTESIESRSVKMGSGGEGPAPELFDDQVATQTISANSLDGTTGNMRTNSQIVEPDRQLEPEAILSPNAIVDEDGRTQLMKYAADGNLANVRASRKFGANVDMLDRKNHTALIHGINGGHANVVRTLVKELRADMKRTYDGGQTPLMFAVRTRKLDTVDVLIKELGANVNSRDDARNTALMHAASSEAIKVVCAMVKKYGVDVNQKNGGGLTVLMYASRSGDLNLAQALLTRLNANVDLRDDSGKTALMYGCEKGRHHVVNALLESRANVDAWDDLGMTALMYASRVTPGIPRRTNVAMVLDLVRNGANVNEGDHQGMTVLMHAARRGNFSVIKELPNLGADLHAVDSQGMTAIMHAARAEHADVVSSLVAMDSTLVRALEEWYVDEENNDGLNSLMLTVQGDLKHAQKRIIEARIEHLLQER